MHRVMVAACACTTALVTAFAPAASAKKPVENASKKLQRAVTVAGVREHQKALQEIADANGGNRFAGRPGHDASAAYAYGVFKKAGWKVAYQDFDYLAFFEDEPSVLETSDGTAVPNTVLEYSGSGEATAPLQRPSDPLGCNAGDFGGFTAGNIAYVNRGTCTFRVKLENAAAAGAAGIVIVNNVPGPLAGTLSAEGGQGAIPGVGIAPEDAAGLAEGDTVHLKVVAHTEDLPTRNVIADSPGGDTSNTVMAGGHLDSVIHGPGIEDDGSGSAALLELAQQFKKAGKLRNHVRLALWTAEESGLVGSTYYVEHLSEAQQKQIALYLNFDMIASPNFARFIYDGSDSDAGSGEIEAGFEQFFDDRGLAHEPTPFDGRSDYGPFIDVGIPSGGLFTGAEKLKTPEQVALYGGVAGQPYDPCYHQACDDYDNNNVQVLDEMSDAIADSIVRYGYSTGPVNGQPDETKGKHAEAHARRR